MFSARCKNFLQLSGKKLVARTSYQKFPQNVFPSNVLTECFLSSTIFLNSLAWRFWVRARFKSRSAESERFKRQIKSLENKTYQRAEIYKAYKNMRPANCLFEFIPRTTSASSLFVGIFIRISSSSPRSWTETLGQHLCQHLHQHLHQHLQQNLSTRWRRIRRRSRLGWIECVGEWCRRHSNEEYA